MLRRMTAVVHDKGSEQGARELHDSLTHVHGLRKEYDARVNESRRLARRYADVKREFDVSQSGTSSAMDGAEVLGARLSTLQMQFNTVMIKLSESSENRRNYELNIAHLKEESLEHSNELKALRKQHADTNLYMKRIEVLRGAAHAERAKSEGELRAFRSEVASYQRFVAEQMAQFQSIVAIVRAQNAARSLARERREKGEEEAVGMRVALLQGETLASAKESAVLATRLQSLELKLRHFEDSFQKISACTGLNHPDAIVNKFFFKADIRAQLQSDIDDKQQKLQQLSAYQGQLRHALGQARLGLREQTWRDVEVLSENAREVSTRTSKAQKEIERVTQRLAFVQEGLLDLLRTATVEAQTEAAAASAADSAAAAAASARAPSPPVDEHALLAMDGADQMQTGQYSCFSLVGVQRHSILPIDAHMLCPLYAVCVSLFLCSGRCEGSVVVASVLAGVRSSVLVARRAAGCSVAGGGAAQPVGSFRDAPTRRRRQASRRDGGGSSCRGRRQQTAVWVRLAPSAHAVAAKPTRRAAAATTTAATTASATGGGVRSGRNKGGLGVGAEGSEIIHTLCASFLRVHTLPATLSTNTTKTAKKPKNRKMNNKFCHATE
jgi:hypothetical protein